jgi:gamma-glutamyltranspeptidase / glutathione hydrolase
MSRGMITAPQPEAVEAGALCLQRGGNAIDAAITCALVETVVDPQMCGVAGFGTMQVFMPKRNMHGFIDFHTTAPAAATADMWADKIEAEARDGFGFFLKDRANEVGHQSIMTPGSLKAFYEAIAEYGTMDWRDIVAPAIAEADQGVVIRPTMHQYWTKFHDYGRVATVDKLGHTPSGKRIYFDDDGNVKRPGDLLENPDMASALRRIAEGGAETFYTGEMAEQMAEDIGANGGLLSHEDLASYETVRSDPLWGTYRGYRLSTGCPPGGGIMILEMLNILENFDLQAMSHNSPEYIRTVAEAMKIATSDKDRFVGDPAFVDVPIDRLTSKDYAATHADAIGRGEKAHVKRFDPTEEPRDTTHISVIDGDGNAVTMTHSLGSPSGVITDGLGFMYNGCMAVFDPRPGMPGSVTPGKRRFTSMAPTMVFRGDEPYIVIGAPGGTFIAMGILQSLLNVFDFGMTISEAVAAPRFTCNSDTIDFSNRIPRFIQQSLGQMGYPTARSHMSYTYAGVHGILIDDQGKWHGGADPGRDGMALEV